MTYESMLLTLVNTIDNMPDLSQDDDTDDFTMDPIIPIHEQIYCPNSPLSFTEQPIEIVNIGSSSISIGPESVSTKYWGPGIWNIFHENNQYYEFKNTRGIITTQTIIKEPNNPKYTLLTNDYIEQKVCTIKPNRYDAITNIKLLINFHPLKYISGELIELVLKVDDNLLFSKTVTVKESTIQCEFINFPNFIINSPKHPTPEIELYIRKKSSSVTNKVKSFKINYDVILFDSNSRSKIFSECKTYIFETASGVICIERNAEFAPRYMTQLLTTIHTDFTKLYTLEEHSESHDQPKFIDENMTISIEI